MPNRSSSSSSEIPRGSRNKYELDKTTGMIRLDRVLYSAVHYPGDYGLIPRTLHEDGDPLDVLVHINEPTFPGCLIRCRAIGMLRMIDERGQDDKVLCVPAHDTRQEHLREHEQRDAGVLRGLDVDAA